MKTLLCYGDSNTWGYIPGGSGQRFDWRSRWPGVLQSRLGDDYRVIEEGLNGRTTSVDDPAMPHRNGLASLPLALGSHYPQDALVIMLGVNDLKGALNRSPESIAAGAAALVAFAQAFQPAIQHILLVCPPVVEIAEDVGFAAMFSGAIELSGRLDSLYQAIATDLGVDYLSTVGKVVSSRIDSIHLDRDNHQQLGEAVADWVLAL